MHTIKKSLRHSFLAVATLATFVAVAPAASTLVERTERAERRFETRYLAALIEARSLVLQLAELAQTKATHEELQQLGEQTELAATTELAQLRAWLEDWHGETHDAELDRKARRLLQKLSLLSGEEFETELIATLIEHHREALREASRALLEAQRPELINLAALSIAASADEVAQLRLWLEQWYGGGAGEAPNEAATGGVGVDANAGVSLGSTAAGAARRSLGH